MTPFSDKPNQQDMPTQELPAQVLWAAPDLHTAIPLLLLALKRYPQPEGGLPTLHDPAPDHDTLHAWLEQVAIRTRLEFKAVETAYPDIGALLNHGGPALLSLPEIGGETGQFVLLVASHRKQVWLLSHTGGKVAIPQQLLLHLLAHPFEQPLQAKMTAIAHQLTPTGGDAQEEVYRVLLAEQLATARIKGVWLLRVAPGESFFRQMWHVQLPKKFMYIILGSLAYQALSILAWAIMGRASLSGNVETAQLQVWGLLLLTLIPLQLMTAYIKNRLSLHAGVLVRTRLLHSILHLEPDTIRQQGSAYFFSTLMNIESLEVSALGIAFSSIMALAQLVIGLFVLASGIGGWLHTILLLVWLGLMLFTIVFYFRAMQAWNNTQQHMASDLIERMSGQRTRLVQECVDQRHVEEDRILAGYAQVTRQMDKMNTLLDFAFSHRSWLFFSLAILIFVYTNNQGPTQMLVSIGGIMFVSGALLMLKQSLRAMLEALISWQQVSSIYQVSREETVVRNTFVHPAEIREKTHKFPLLEARQLSYTYPAGNKVILAQCDFTIAQGQKILLEGSSGSGKSTFATLLAGMRTPDTGSIRLYGLMQDALGAHYWRKQVVISPQFHENHVLSETLAFNLLMGRQWPPSAEDMEEAMAICYELQLGKLLETMPAGMQQMVGESGWRLSHGEKSRLFIARTLLQGSDLIILDESFAALDPETLQLALACVIRRSNALLLIAHP